MTKAILAPEWTAQALCAQADPEEWFPPKGGSTRNAKRICRDCTVKLQCLQLALDNDEHFGVWGALSEQERHRLKQNMAAMGVTKITHINLTTDTADAAA